MAFLYGCAGCLTAKNGGSRPGQIMELAEFMDMSLQPLWTSVPRSVGGLDFRCASVAIIIAMRCITIITVITTTTSSSITATSIITIITIVIALITVITIITIITTAITTNSGDEVHP